MPTKTVIYKKKKITLNDSDALGAGGEGTVILHGKEALKIYHDPSPQRAKKLVDFVALNLSLPENVAAPSDLVYDTKSDVIGFGMPAALKFQEAIRLSNKKIRNVEQITTNNIITFFLHMKITLDILNGKGVFVGDYNDLNVLYNAVFQSGFIDVDAYQFGQYPCPVGTEPFLDPSLYGLDLSTKPYFSKETDWYSFSVMLFKCLLWAHPYGGVHDQYQSIVDRAKRNITVFDDGVIYPRIALKPETLSNELLDHFHTVFKLGKRPDLPVALLESHLNSFEKCTQCNVFYYKGRGRCPMCYGTTVKPPIDVTQILVSHTVDKDRCLAEPMFETEGVILFCKVLEDKRIIVVEYTGKETMLRILRENDSASNFKLWSGHIKNVKYDFFSDYLIVGIDDDVLIFEAVMGQSLKPISKTTTMKYDGALVFGCSEKKLYRLTEQTMLSSEIVNAGGSSGFGALADTVVTQTLHNQTWFEIGSSGLGLAYFRVFNAYYYFVFSSKGRYEVKIPPLKGKLIETVVEISKNTLLLLQKTLDNGRTYSYKYLIDEMGEILESKVEESIGSELLKNLTGKYLIGTTIIHPTDAGIVMERKGVLTLKKETAQYVDSGCSLYLYKDGILSVSEHKVEFLRLIK